MTYGPEHPNPSGCMGQAIGMLVVLSMAAGLIWLAHHFHLLGF